MLTGLVAWVLGVALQLQQAALWPLWGYGVCLLAGALLAGVPGVECLRSAKKKGPGAQGVRKPGRVAAVVLAAVLLAWGLTGARAVLFQRHALDPALQGQDIEVTGRVASMPRSSAGGERFEFAIDSARLAGAEQVLPERVLLTWYAPDERRPDAGASPGLVAGERWRFTVRLRLPHGNANPHGFDWERWLWERGLQATGYVRTGPRDPVPQRLGSTLLHPLEQARQRVVRSIQARVPDPRQQGVLAALVAGDQAAIERTDWELFRATGVAHLMSISGLHVTMFAWLAMALVRQLWRRTALLAPRMLLAVPAPHAAAWGGLALAAAYALFSGWGVPSQRTLLMLAVVLGLRRWSLRWPWPVVWLLAMAAVLLLDPWALLQPGFWLSFVAVGILFASAPRARPDPDGSAASTASPPGAFTVWGRRLWRSLLALVRTQSVVTLALAPLSLFLFGQFSVVGLVANLVAIPWVTLVVLPLAMAGLVVAPLWDLAAWSVQWLTQVLQGLSAWPLASVHRAIAPWPLAVAGVLGGVLLVLRVPWAVRLTGLTLLWPCVWWTPLRPPPGAFDILAMDVGQGSAVLVRTASHSLLYDTGPRYSPDSDAGERVVLPLLRAMGEQPDAVVVSHRDSDHAGGVAAVRAAFPQARWLSSFDADARQHCQAGQRWVWDGVVFEVLHPAPADYVPGGKPLSSNAMSCVLRVGNAGQGALLAGDLPSDQEVRLALAHPELRADWLLAPHHGSLTSSSPVWLNVLRPRWVVIQAGYRNPFGHPAPAVLERYRQRGIRWVASPDCGAALWRSTTPDAVHCERQTQRRYWHRPGAPGSWPD